MSQKTVFFDIDGTIMDEFGFIPPSAVEAIHAAQAKGVKCIVNTGRPYTHIEPSIVDIGFDGYICSCGQLLMMDGKRVFRAGVDAEVCGEIVKRAQDCLLDAYYEAEESMRQMLHHEPDKGMRIYLDRMIERGFEVWNDPREPCYCFDKFCIWARHDSLLEPFAEYAEKYYTLINRGGGMFECIHKGYSKATGMERVREMTGGRVAVGPGTLYHLLDQFCESGMIKETRVEGRRRSYLLTEKGRAALEAEVRRMTAQLNDYAAAFGKEDVR